MVNVQQWVDWKYPKDQRVKVDKIYLDVPSLAGELDLRDFTYRGGAKLYISACVDETKLIFKNKPEEVEIILEKPRKYKEELVSAQEWLDKNYPSNGTCIRKEYGKNHQDFGKKREEITELGGYRNNMDRVIDSLSSEGLGRTLDLNNFTNLKIFYFIKNKLTSLDLTNCEKLEEIDCSGNLLTAITLPINPTNLKYLNLNDNNFPATQDLSFLEPCVNLEELKLGNWQEERINQDIYNRFTGSLDYLSGMKKLKELDISNTDLNEVNLDKLSESLEEIRCSTYKRQGCKLVEIAFQLEKFNKYGWCYKCQQFNNTKKRCQSCFEKGWQQDLKQPTQKESIKKFNFFSWFGKKYSEKPPELIEKFIQQVQLPSSSLLIWKLQWIPYEQFAEVEYLAEGGFSKVYKAKLKSELELAWKEKPKKRNYTVWPVGVVYLIKDNFSKICKFNLGKSKSINNRIVVLKSFNGSQNITLDFLNEIANTSLVDADSKSLEANENIVACWGISQNPRNRNYIMVMPYMEGGNLRQHLKNKNSELSLKDKLKKLNNIAEGLNDIHKQNLIHRDFHSGNVLNSSNKNDMHSYITDFGLSYPASYQKKEDQIFGVPPYIAPEVLQGKPYTKASDIYSFGVVAYELLVNAYPYPKMDDLNLVLKVCQGLRPDIDKVPIPQLLKDLIKSCWDVDPKKRPIAEELYEIINYWCGEIRDEDEKYYERTHFYQQYQLLEQEYNTFSQKPYQIYPNATLTSKPINTKKITEKLMEFSQSIEFNLDELDDLLKEYEENNLDWTSIRSSFTPNLIQSWTNLNFTSQQTQDWINIGLQPTDYNFCAWLRDNKHFTPEQVLNHHNLEQLNQEFFNWWQEQQSAQTEVPPK